MKFLLLLLILGVAAASFLDVLEETKNDILLDFHFGMDETIPLKEFANFGPEADEIESDVKTELGKSLRETLDTVLQKIRNAVDSGKQVKEELLDKAAEITEQLKLLGVDIGGKALDLLHKIKEKAKNWFQSLLEKMGLGKRGLGDMLSQLLQKIQVPAILESLKAKLLQKVDLESLTAYIKNLFGTFSNIAEKILEPLRSRGIRGLQDLFEKILDRVFPSRSNYYGVDFSLVELWSKVRNYFKDLGSQVRSKLIGLTEWVKTLLEHGSLKIQDSIGKLRLAAKEIILQAKELSREACQDALNMFHPFKEQLGDIWEELKDAVSTVLNKI